MVWCAVMVGEGGGASLQGVVSVIGGWWGGDGVASDRIE